MQWSRARAPVVLLLLCGLFLALGAYLGFVQVDDAYITFRYSRNWATGLGPVWNLGERVEGYTSFLWMALLAGLFKLGADLPSAATVAGGLGGAGTVAATYLLATRVFERGAPWALAAAALVALSTCHAYHALNGMETPLYGLLLTLALATHLGPARTIPRRALAEGTLLAFAALTRPEGLAFVCLFGMGHLVRAIRPPSLAAARPGPDIARWLPLGLFVLPFLCTVLPHTLWRLSYYGHLLPNTFYAKVGFTRWQVLRGLRYVAGYLVDSRFPALWLPFLIGIVRRRDDRPVRFLLAAFALQVTYISFVGGDGFPFYRFFVPILPVQATLLALGLRELTRFFAERKAQPVLAFGLVGVLALLALEGSIRRPMTIRAGLRDADRDYLQRYLAAGRYLSAHACPGEWVGTVAPGAIGYVSGLPVLDLLGLTDEHVAHLRVETMGKGNAGHEKGDADYVLKRSPDYLLLPAVWLEPEPLTFDRLYAYARILDSRFMKNLIFRPELPLRYEIVNVPIGDRFLGFLKKKGTPPG